MKRDPLDLTISLLFNINLLEKDETYNISELKNLRNLDFHWNTISKYLKMFKIIQDYCPKFEILDSKLHIINTKLYDRLNNKERFILYLFNRGAISRDKAIEISTKFPRSKEIQQSIGLLYEKIDSGKYYLNKAGLDIYRSIKQNLADLIFNEKKIDEIFPYSYSDESSAPKYEFQITLHDHSYTNMNVFNFIQLKSNNTDSMEGKRVLD